MKKLVWVLLMLLLDTGVVGGLMFLFLLVMVIQAFVLFM